MENFNLNIITEEHIAGKWEVIERAIPAPSEISALSTIDHLEIDKGIFKYVNGKKCKGKLALVHETDIIYNPQLLFYIKENQVENAIITRLYSENNGKQETFYLTLYFTTGLELVLQKNTTLKI